MHNKILFFVLLTAFFVISYVCFGRKGGLIEHHGGGGGGGGGHGGGGGGGHGGGHGGGRGGGWGRGHGGRGSRGGWGGYNTGIGYGYSGTYWPYDWDWFNEPIYYSPLPLNYQIENDPCNCFPAYKGAIDAGATKEKSLERLFACIKNTLAGGECGHF